MSYAEVGAKPWYQHTLSDGLVVDEAQPGNVFVVGHGRQPSFGRAFGAEGDPTIKEAHGYKYKASDPGTVVFFLALGKETSYAPLPAGVTYRGKPVPKGTIFLQKVKPAAGKSVSDWLSARIKDGVGVIAAEGTGFDASPELQAMAAAQEGHSGFLVPTKNVALASLITMDGGEDGQVIVEPTGGWPKPGTANGKAGVSTTMMAAGVGVAALLIGGAYYMTREEKSYARNPEPWQYGLGFAAVGGAAFLGVAALWAKAPGAYHEPPASLSALPRICDYTVWQMSLHAPGFAEADTNVLMDRGLGDDPQTDVFMVQKFMSMNLDPSKKWILEKRCPPKEPAPDAVDDVDHIAFR